MEPESCIPGLLSALSEGSIFLTSQGNADPGLALPLFGLAFLLLGSALVSGSEVAFFSLSAGELHAIKSQKGAASRRIVHLTGHPRILLATILISNNFINIAIVILADLIMRRVFPSGIYERWAAEILGMQDSGWLTIVGLGRIFHFVTTIVAVTFLLVLFGEVAPKVYARFNNVGLARTMSGPLTVLSRIFHPLIWLLVRGSGFIESALSRGGVGNADGDERKADIHEAIELTVRQDQGGAQEIDLLKSIIDFGDVTVKQIMRSRVDVVGVDFRIGYRELLQVIRESGFSRLPVYDEDLDNITGILYVKDLLGNRDEEEQFEWQALIRTDVLYVPESKKIQDLLKEFQERHLHMGIVVDEYGGSSGIVTLEDILEEIIGDIRDEFDEEEEVDYEKLDDFNYIFEGKTLLKDACRVTGIDEAVFESVRGDADSVAGLLLEILGVMPRKGTEVTHEAYTFRIVAANERRIERVRITLPPDR